MDDSTIHEMFDIADKVANLINIDDDGRFFVIDDQGNETEDTQDLLVGVQTLVDIIQKL